MGLMDMKDVKKMKIKEMLKILEDAIDIGQYYEGDLYEYLCREDKDERDDEIEEEDNVFINAHKVLKELKRRLVVLIELTRLTAYGELDDNEQIK